MSTTQTTLLSFFGGECWPYVLGDSFAVKAVITHKEENGDYRNRIVVTLKCAKVFSIVSGSFLYKGMWESAQLADGKILNHDEVLTHTTDGLFTYLRECNEQC